MAPSPSNQNPSSGHSTVLVQVPVDEDVILPGALTTVPNGVGVVLIASAAGAGDLGAVNDAVAHELQRGGLFTLFVDLITPAEGADHQRVLDVGRLAQRLIGVRRWLTERSETSALPVGLFGAGVGAAVALRAAAVLGDAVTAVVSRSGRSDLVARELERVRAPTLLIAGGRDGVMLGRNVEALARLTCERHLEVLRDTAEPLDGPVGHAQMERAMRRWFTTHLGAVHPLARQAG